MPFSNQVILHCRHPDRRIVRLLVRPVRMAEDHDDIFFRLHPFEGVPVSSHHRKEFFPALEHDILRPADVIVAVDEGVVVRHQRGKTGEIVIVDALVELVRDELGVFCVQMKNKNG